MPQVVGPTAAVSGFRRRRQHGPSRGGAFGWFSGVCVWGVGMSENEGPDVSRRRGDARASVNDTISSTRGKVVFGVAAVILGVYLLITMIVPLVTR